MGGMSISVSILVLMDRAFRLENDEVRIYVILGFDIEHW